MKNLLSLRSPVLRLHLGLTLGPGNQHSMCGLGSLLSPPATDLPLEIGIDGLKHFLDAQMQRPIDTYAFNGIDRLGILLQRLGHEDGVV